MQGGGGGAEIDPLLLLASPSANVVSMAQESSTTTELSALLHLPVEEATPEEKVFELVRRIDPASLHAVPSWTATPEGAAGMLESLEVKYGCPGYMTKGLCQYDVRWVF